MKNFFCVSVLLICKNLECGGFSAFNANYGDGITINIRNAVRVVDEDTVTIGTIGKDVVNITLNVFTSDLDKMRAVIRAKSIKVLCPVNVTINIYGEEAYNNIKAGNLCVKDMIVVDDYNQINKNHVTVHTKFFPSEVEASERLGFLQNSKIFTSYYVIPVEEQNSKIYSQNSNLAVSKYTLLNFINEHNVLDFQRGNKIFYKSLYNRIYVSQKTFGVKCNGCGVLIGVQRCFDDVDVVLNVGAIFGDSTVNVATAGTAISFPCDSENFCGTGIAKYYFNDHLFFYSFSGILYSRFKNDITNLNDAFYVQNKNDLWYFSESLGLGYICKGETADVGFNTAFKFDYESSPSRTEKVGGETINYDKFYGKFLFYDVNCSLCLKTLPYLKSLSFIFGAEFEVNKKVSGQSVIVNEQNTAFECCTYPKSLFFAKILIEKKLSENSELSLSCSKNWASGVKSLTASTMISFDF